MRRKPLTAEQREAQDFLHVLAHLCEIDRRKAQANDNKHETENVSVKQSEEQP